MRASSHKLRFARQLRKQLSPPEVRLWVRLRARIEGRPAFHRQRPIGPYIADFFCPAARLVVEVDGGHHAALPQSEHDAARDAYLAMHGFRVLRIWAADIMRDPDGAAEWVIAEATNRMHG